MTAAYCLEYKFCLLFARLIFNVDFCFRFNADSKIFECVASINLVNILSIPMINHLSVFYVDKNSFE